MKKILKDVAIKIFKKKKHENNIINNNKKKARRKEETKKVGLTNCTLIGSYESNKDKRKPSPCAVVWC